MSALAVPCARPALAEGDPQRGEAIGYTCLGCHGIPGYRNAYPSYRVPKLGGQKPAALTAALKAYRDRNRQHHTMQAQGAVLDDQDIEDIVAWLSRQGPPAKDDLDVDSVRGQETAEVCVACHGTEGANVTPVPPVLSGQHESYLRQALLQYKEGKRGDTVMSAFSAGLAERDIDRLAAFYAAQEGLYTVGEGD
jgi:cytochrome c553